MKTPVIFIKGEDINIPSLDGESWVKVRDTCVNNIRPYYYISTFGRVYSFISNRFMNPTLSPVGYLVVTIRKNDNTGVTAFIHRMVFMSFCYIEGCEELQVNHIDGNPLNNNIWNLEWVAIAQNVHHASQNGLLLSGDNAPWTKISSKQVDYICKLYLDGYEINDIEKITGYNLSTLYDILQGRTRKEKHLNLILNLDTKTKMIINKVQRLSRKGVQPKPIRVMHLGPV